MLVRLSASLNAQFFFGVSSMALEPALDKSLEEASTAAGGVKMPINFRDVSPTTIPISIRALAIIDELT